MGLGWNFVLVSVKIIKRMINNMGKMFTYAGKTMRTWSRS
jgi:hypothetical protein